MRFAAFSLPLVVAAGIAVSGMGHQYALSKPVQPKFTVSINYGPGSVRPNVNCEWMANVIAGGTPPFTWQWTVNGSNVPGNGGGPNDIYYVNSGGSFTLGIIVTDSLGAIASDSKAISVHSSAPYCNL